MVAGILCGSVVAKIKITCDGGSSNVFNKALKAAVLSICASSIIYTFFRKTLGKKLTFSRISRISSTPLLLAASNSTISVVSLFIIARQFLQ